jgi:hypothetical protein
MASPKAHFLHHENDAHEPKSAPDDMNDRSDSRSAWAIRPARRIASFPRLVDLRFLDRPRQNPSDSEDGSPDQTGAGDLVIGHLDLALG